MYKKISKKIYFDVIDLKDSFLDNSKKCTNALQSHNGLSLIELLVVIGIIGVLASAVIAVLNPFAQIKKGNDAKRKSDLALMQRALEDYYNDHAIYPAGTAADPRIFDATAGVINWGNPWPKYMATLPKDPKQTAVATSSKYYYIQRNAGQGYALYARLERDTQDPQICTGTTCPNRAVNGAAGATSCGSGPCNYGVSSSNTKP